MCKTSTLLGKLSVDVVNDLKKVFYSRGFGPPFRKVYLFIIQKKLYSGETNTHFFRTANNSECHSTRKRTLNMAVSR